MKFALLFFANITLLLANNVHEDMLYQRHTIWHRGFSLLTKLPKNCVDHYFTLSDSEQFCLDTDMQCD